jgi:hypothetical protein
VVVAGFTNSSNFPTRNPPQAGNAGSDDAYIARIVEDAPDPTPPTTTIALAGTAGLAGWNRSPVTVTLAATDAAAESGVAFVDYKIDDGPFQRYWNAFTIVAEGISRVSGRATDNSGNVEAPPVSALVKIDTGSPALTLDSPVERDYLHTEALTLSFSAHDDVSGLAGGSPSAALDGVVESNGWTIQLLTLPLGAHTFIVSATDAAGNLSQRSRTFHVVATIRSLIAAVDVYGQQGRIAPTTLNTLNAKLNDAQDAFDRGNVTVVRNKLSDFIDACGKRVASDVAAVLIADAQYVIGGL